MSIINILGESAVRSLALALAVAIVLRVLRVQHARLAKRAWTSVLILSLAMPVLVALHIPAFSFTALWSTPRAIVVNTVNTEAPPVSIANAVLPARQYAVNHSIATAETAQPEDLAPAVTPSVPVPAGLQGPPQGAPAPARHIALWQIGFAAYLAITVLLLLRVVLGLALAARLWRRAQPFAVSETDIPGDLSGRPPVRLSVRLSVDLRSPATVGHGILLPLEAIGWDDAALSTTLAHEAKHVREGDFYLQLAATLHHCFFWISPHAWWLRPQLSRLSETICDRAAIASSGDGLSYAELLIRFATAEQTPAGMVAMAQSAGLRERIDRLIADPELTGAFRHRRGQAILAGALFAAAAVVTAATVHFVQPATIVLAAPQAPAPPAAPTSDAAPQTAPTPDAAPQAPGAGTGVGTGEGAGTGDSYAPPAPPADVAPVPDTATAPVAPVPPSDAVIAPEDHVILNVHPDVTPVIAVAPVMSVHPVVATDVHMSIDDDSQIEIASQDDAHSRGYAIYGPDSDHTVMMHGWFGDADKLKDEHAKHPGGAILFRRDGKTWIIDNPTLVKQAQEAYAPVSKLGKQQGELGAKQGELGARQGELGAIQGEIGAQQGNWGAMQGKFAGDFHQFEMPKDFDKTVQEFADSESRLALESDTMNAEQRAALETQNKEVKERLDKVMAQFKAQQPQREAMEKQMRDQAEQMRKQMEPLMKQMRELGEKQGELGRMQGELGRQQGILGRQQGAASREANSKVQSLIDQAVKDGSAHPVQ